MTQEDYVHATIQRVEYLKKNTKGIITINSNEQIT